MKLPLPKPGGYMIYDHGREMFAKGGMCNFTKKGGKIWQGLGPLKNHLQQYIQVDYRERKIYIFQSDMLKNCVVYDILTQEPVPDFNIIDYLVDVINRKYIDKYYKSYTVVI